jgi:hypothetical protein
VFQGGIERPAALALSGEPLAGFSVSCSDPFFFRKLAFAFLSLRVARPRRPSANLRLALARWPDSETPRRRSRWEFKRQHDHLAGLPRGAIGRDHLDDFL